MSERRDTADPWTELSTGTPTLVGPAPGLADAPSVRIVSLELDALEDDQMPTQPPGPRASWIPIPEIDESSTPADQRSTSLEIPVISFIIDD